jgi:hypothetical protein
MPSTFTINKSIEKPSAGSYNNTWATPVNADWDDIDNALGGNTAINVTGVAAGTYAFTLPQYQPPNIVFTGTLGANLVYAIPSGVGGIWSVFNSTSGAFTLTFGSGGGGSLALPQGTRTLVVCDGVNVQTAQSALAFANPTAKVGLTPVNGVAGTAMASDSAPPLDQTISPVMSGVWRFNGTVTLAGAVSALGAEVLAAGASIDATAGTLLTATQATGDNSTKAASTAFVNRDFAPLISPALAGSPTAPTQSPGDATTKIATDAFVAAAIAALTVRAGGNINGSIKVGSLLINYGQHNTSGSSPDVISYTTPYTSAVFSVIPYLIDANMVMFVSSGFTTTLNHFTLNFGAIGQLMGWVSIGI